MKLLTLVLLSCSSLFLVACGSMGMGNMNGSNLNSSNNMSGNWTVTMMNQSGAQTMVFSTALNEDSGNIVTARNLQFMTPTACFPSGSSGTGAAMPTPGTNGSMTGSFGMTVQSAGMQSSPMGMGMGMMPTDNNVLTLQGTMSNNNTVSGNWNMSGVMSGCSGSGTFTMTRM